MAFVVIYQSNEECFLVDNEEEIPSTLKDYEWELEDVSIFELGKPFEYEVKFVRKVTLVRKDK